MSKSAAQAQWRVAVSTKDTVRFQNVPCAVKEAGESGVSLCFLSSYFAPCCTPCVFLPLLYCFCLLQKLEKIKKMQMKERGIKNPYQDEICGLKKTLIVDQDKMFNQEENDSMSFSGIAGSMGKVCNSGGGARDNAFAGKNMALRCCRRREGSTSRTTPRRARRASQRRRMKRQMVWTPALARAEVLCL